MSDDDAEIDALKDPTFAREGELEIGVVQQVEPARPLPDMQLYQPQNASPFWVPKVHYTTPAIASGFPSGTSSREPVRRLVRVKNRGNAGNGITYRFATEGLFSPSAGYFLPGMRFACCCDIIGIAGGSVLRPAFFVTNYLGAGEHVWTPFGPKVLSGDWGTRLVHPDAMTTINLSIQFNPGENRPGARIWSGIIFFINFYAPPELRWT